ncbi:MAG: hypothetical protein A07HB70_00576 [uncultured archaeon A07HB70]|jgi:hypothetical protein|nr:MAG: hypothetical protein A07HB70_00576 [uncultured archaeon A07HB70]
MIILFQAYNGVVGLPITALPLFWAVNDSEIMCRYTNGWKLNVINSVLVFLTVYSAWSAGQFVIGVVRSCGSTNWRARRRSRSPRRLRRL